MCYSVVWTVERTPLGHYYTYAMAMQSISTKAPAGNPTTAKVALAGGSIWGMR
jgi:hypothetical protein